MMITPKTQEFTFNIRKNVGRIHFSPTLEINERVRSAREQGKEVLHMGFGQSPFPAHPLIQEALADSADKNMYLPSAGLPELRELSRHYLSEKFGFDANDFKTIVGPGSKELIYDIQLAVEGDLLLPVPSWVSYAPQAVLIDDPIIKIPTTITDNYHITAESLEETIVVSRQKGMNPRKLILNYPNNPSGLTMAPDRLEQIAHVCRKQGILVISDEIYGLVNYKQNHTSIAKFYTEGTIVTSGLSKHLSLGGYRLGVAFVPKALNSIFEAMVGIASETWSTVSAPIQFAALKAFANERAIEEYIKTCTKIHSMVSSYVRDVLVSMGIEYPDPEGAFYLYPNFSSFRDQLISKGVKTSEELAMHMLDKIQIAALPGTAFGDAPKNLTLRLASCDFDGKATLKYYSDHPDCAPGSLVHACCPRIELACHKMENLIK
ncbi:MAG: aminotransferase class I/II-fold pyridoxal phosphate-dependent enzyme [Anaerolineales bacterium]